MSIQSAHIIPEFTRGDGLRKARETTGMGHSEFAEALGISRNTVTNYERDHVEPRRVVIIAWSMATGVPRQWLETGEAPSPDGEGTGLREWYAPRDSNPEPSDSGSGLIDISSRIQRVAA